ncbi:Aldo/keto reductase [Fomes fomentarius]|nr:Aldo/keto reductase [Fomes fomentarius]
MSALELWAVPYSPKTKLGRHRQLSPTAGIHVSPICLGAMSIGDKWAQYGMGSMDKESSFKLLDAFYDAGGNFIDASSNYQDESSEEFIGEWMETRGIRDQMVIATKAVKQQTHYVGNNMETLQISVEESLKKLHTSYIDILYVHWWDYSTSIEEVMNGLHALVMAGKVLYLIRGISDTSAWIVPRANRYARMSNRTPFVIYEGAWTDVIPMASAEGMALAPWNVGKIKTDAEELSRAQTGEKVRDMAGVGYVEWQRTEQERKVAKALEEVAAEVGAPNTQAVAIAYVMQKTPYVFPIVGGRKIEHLYKNIQALDVALSDEHIKKIERAMPFVKGSPYDDFGDGYYYGLFHANGGNLDKWPVQPAIRPTH